MTDVTIAWSVCMYMCIVCHTRAPSTGWNGVIVSNTVLDRDASLTTRRGDLGVGTLSFQRCRLLPNYFGPYFVL